MTTNQRSTSRRTLLASSGSLALLGLAGCLGDDDGDDGDDGDDDGDNGSDDNGSDLEVEEFQLLDRDHDEDVIAYVHGDHWDHGPLVVPEGDNVSLGARIEDEDGEEIDLEEAGLDLEGELVGDGDDTVSLESHGDHIHVEGEEEGFADVVFQLVEDDEVVYETPGDDEHPLEVEVGDGDQEYVDEDDDHDHDDDNDHDDDGHDHDDDNDHDDDGHGHDDGHDDDH
ncbi:hypothetical protein [Natronorubrum daqingense]|uniref:Zinc transport system substrate-binding protein n=1 Tax=Natronorubrum daqingense TaxID=588898 RepID=A0A1N6XQS2_9EURY|nr:hypothetical protein [Natronorubrum daqingense]APX95886.1 hypothetical protein BB347_04225 [Natronorubrum daqingense]SIR04667.1 hypothetical protein SAMN05421809_0190 [Natronorubrum daqingense]